MIDAVVVGSGPNGLAAAITLARAGLQVRVLEGADVPGGAVRSAALTRPGFVHDVCSAIHPFAVGSPFFRSLRLEHHGLRWVWSPSVLAQATDAGPVLLERTIADTARGLGRDGEAWRRLFAPTVAHLDEIVADLLGPPRIPRHPLVAARFGLQSLPSAVATASLYFEGTAAAALFGGVAAHASVPLEQPLTTSIGLVLGGLGHVVGWPFPRGGAQRFTDALVSCLRAHGGEIVVGRPVADLDELPPSRVVMLDVTPRQLVALAGDRLPARFRAQMEAFRYGPAVFKLDYALSGPVPWSSPQYARAATVHVGGDLDEMAASERAVARGEVSDRPYVLVAQHSLFDDSRAPAGQHTLWAYCHVPQHWSGSVVEAVERQLERFAPGFGDRILERSVMGPARIEAFNPNLVGGSIDGGAATVTQIVTRPRVALDPYATPLPGVYLCSSSTPPGPGVHGLCGFHAARSALRGLRVRRRA